MIRPLGADFVTCHCGKMARRSQVNRVAVIGQDADVRGMYRRFTEASAEGASPDYEAAKAKAAAIAARGETLTVRS